MVITRHAMTLSARRTGTTWLMRMLQRNGEVGGPLFVTHEGFRQNPIRMLVNWTEPGIHVNIGHVGTSMFFEAKKRFPNLAYCVLVREPMNHAASLCFNAVEIGLQLERIAFEWGALNTCIGRLKAAGLPYDVWDLSYYTTEKGFRELAEFLGVPLKSAIEMMPPEHKRRAGVVPDEWPDVMKNVISELFEGNEYLKAAYDSARR